MQSWKNPHQAVQQSIRSSLKTALMRTNGAVTKDQVLECLKTDDPIRAQKILQQLFSSTDDGSLQWKPDFTSYELLEKRLNGNKAVDLQKIETLYKSSRAIDKRTKHPYIAPSNK